MDNRGKIMGISKHLQLASLAILVLVVMFVATGCGDNDSTPILTPTITPTPTPTTLHVEVIIYSDFQCENCAKLFFSVEEELVRLYGNNSTVSIEVRPMNVMGNASQLAGEAALCAKDQGKFWEYSNALYTAWQKDGKSAYSEQELIKKAVALGLNEQTFGSCLGSGAKAAQLKANEQALEDSGGTEIPTVFINGYKIEDVKPLQTYVDYINSLLSNEAAT